MSDPPGAPSSPPAVEATEQAKETPVGEAPVDGKPVGETPAEVAAETGPDVGSPVEAPPTEHSPSESSPKDSSPKDSSPQDSSPQDSSPQDSSPREVSPGSSPDASPREILVGADGPELLNQPTPLVDASPVEDMADMSNSGTDLEYTQKSVEPDTRYRRGKARRDVSASEATIHKQSGVYPIHTKALKVHPRGFKVLAGTSPIERSLKTYFRLPALPTEKNRQEAASLAKLNKFSSFGAEKAVVLDGFLLLDWCKVEDPEDALEAIITDANLNKVIPEDLAFFTKLEFLDLGENNIQMSHLAGLVSIQELHLHCNQLQQIHCPAAAFQMLETLNLSYNQLDSSVFSELVKLPLLARLDLSCNNLTSLPADLSGLKLLAQLALENNLLEKESVFHSLGTLPSLLEVNLNYNKLRRVPRLQNKGFPLLEVMGLAANQFEFFEDLYTLTEYSSLRRVVLWGNNIQNRKKDLGILNYELYQLDIAVICEGPLPPKRRIGEFYTVNINKMVKVEEFRHKLRPKRKDRREAPKPQPPIPSTAPAGDAGSSFFITGANLTEDPNFEPTPTQPTAGSGSREFNAPNFGRTTSPVGFFADEEEETPRGSSVRGHEEQSPTDFRSPITYEEDPVVEEEVSEYASMGPSTSAAHQAVPHQPVRPGRKYRPPGNMRSAIKELKHLLNQNPAPMLGRKPSFLKGRTLP